MTRVSTEKALRQQMSPKINKKSEEMVMSSGRKGSAYDRLYTVKGAVSPKKQGSSGK